MSKISSFIIFTCQLMFLFLRYLLYEWREFHVFPLQDLFILHVNKLIALQLHL